MDDHFTQALLTEFIRRLCIHDKEFGTYYSYYLPDAQSDLKILAQLLGQSISHVQTKEYEHANDKDRAIDEDVLNGRHFSRRTSRDTE